MTNDRLKDRVYSKAYRLRHPDRRRQSQAAYASKNREKIRARGKAYYARTKAKRKAYYEKYMQVHRLKLRDKMRTWRKRNPDRTKASYTRSRHKRRDRERLVESCDTVSANALTQLIQSMPKMRCALCNKNMRKGDRTIDHVIPLSKGGSGHIGNLQIVHGACNSSKRDKLPHELDGQLQIKFAGNVAA